MDRIELPQGVVEYRAIGSGPAIVFVHGLLVDGSLWRPVADRLARSHRCIVPTLPLGSHRVALSATADRTPTGIARLVADLIRALELDDVTLVGNDSGGVIAQIVAARHRERIARLVLTNCDGLEIFPPPAFAYLGLLPKVPWLLTALARAFHWFPALARLPMAYGALTEARLSAELLAAWTRPGLDAEVRRDALAFISGVDTHTTLAVADELHHASVPTRLIWGAEDRFFSLDFAERLRAALRGELVVIPGARTFVPLDAPDRVADEIAAFVGVATPLRSIA